MNKDRTLIVLVVDNSGSMASGAAQASRGINTLIEEQKNGEHVVVRIVNFDTSVRVVEDNTRIEEVKEYRLRPGGATALFDAVGQTIKDVNKYITKMPKTRRPGLVVFKIVTDGYENSSRTYWCPGYRNSRFYGEIDLTKMIQEQKEKGWHFSFLGQGRQIADIGNLMGIETSYSYAQGRDKEVYCASSSKITRMRSQIKSGMEVVNEYTTEEKGMFSC